MSFDPQSSAQAFITGPAEMKVPLPTSEIVTSDKMDIKVDRLAYRALGQGRAPTYRTRRQRRPWSHHYGTTRPNFRLWARQSWRIALRSQAVTSEIS